MRFPRSSGILLHITSLPGRFGVGDMGAEAYGFARFLADSEQSLWQILSLGPTGYGNSPYQCFSVFAGNPLLISPEKLVSDNLLQASDLEVLPCFREGAVDYECAGRFKSIAFRKSFETFTAGAPTDRRERFDRFCMDNAHWLDTFALFMALKESHGYAPWTSWEDDIRSRSPAALSRSAKELSGETGYQKYLQYLFFDQWLGLKKFCNEQRIKIVGDVPIFVALDSADVWEHQALFHLDEAGKPTVVAGVPPDYFSATGQFWGNPLYRWDVMAGDGYRWWMERLKAARAMVDIIRIDHFRGFEKYWEIPGGDTTAVNGRWMPGPGAALFEAMKRELGDLPIVAEDLGYITPEVHALRDRFDFPGMKVLQFSFGGDPRSREGRPFSYPRNCLVYTGTHDNDTVVGWFRGGRGTTLGEAEKEAERRFVLQYMGTDGREINWDFIRAALASVADVAITPLQDVLGLGSEARMNLPGTTKDNWMWRLTPGMISEEVKARLRELTVVYGRGVSNY